MSSTEIWRPVPGFDGAYMVSDAGRVRSLERTVRQVARWGWMERRVEERILRPSRCRKWGYSRVMLYDGTGHATYRTVHSLVCEAFIGDRPTRGHIAEFINGDPCDCRLENLRWVMRQQPACFRQKAAA